MRLNSYSFVIVQEVQEEGKYAIDSPGNPAMSDLPPEEYTLGTFIWWSKMCNILFIKMS